MARTASTATPRTGGPATVGQLLVNPHAREHMVREAAYYRSMQRGFEPGHDLEDWLAAEDDVERSIRRRPPGPGAAAAEPRDDPGTQHGGAMGPAEDDRLKRTVRAHPHRDISRVESMEPEEAPPRQ